MDEEKKKERIEYYRAKYIESSLDFWEWKSETQIDEMLDNFSINSDEEDIERYMRGKWD